MVPDFCQCHGLSFSLTAAFINVNLSVFLYILSVCVCAEAYPAQGLWGLCPWYAKQGGHMISYKYSLDKQYVSDPEKSSHRGHRYKKFICPPFVFSAPDKNISAPPKPPPKKFYLKILDTPLIMCLSTCVWLWIAKTFLTKFCVAVIYCLWIFGVFVQI